MISRFGASFGEAARDVGAGAFVGAHAGEHDPPQGVVGLAVAAAVEPVAGRSCPTRRGSGRRRTGARRRLRSVIRSALSPAATNKIAAVWMPTP